MSTVRMTKKMRAVVIEDFGGPDQLAVREIDRPDPGPGEVLIKVKAFGLNHAETYFRKGVWGDVPRVTGIECVGEVEKDPSGTLPKGLRVATITGGLGRFRNGSYAEFVSALAGNVYPLETSLPWADLAAIPESYATAWSCLFDCLRLERGDTILVRGATSALGQAALNVAVHAGATVVSTTRNARRKESLLSLGASHVLIEKPDLSAAALDLFPEGIDHVLELVGNSTFRDSMKAVKRGGRVCLAGFLGGGEPVPFDILTGMKPGVDVCFFASLFLGVSPEFPASRIPMQMLVENVEKGFYQAKPAKVFRFDELPEAHRLMESNTANGKIVVVMD